MLGLTLGLARAAAASPAPGRSGGAGLWLRSDDGAAPAPQQAVTPVTASRHPASLQQAPLDKYRIAVLPFANISADPEDEYFSDGMTEELISKLSRLRDLTVIARTSVMQYKGDRQEHRRDRAGAAGRHDPRGQRAQGRRSPAHHRAADRC